MCVCSQQKVTKRVTSARASAVSQSVQTPRTLEQTLEKLAAKEHKKVIHDYSRHTIVMQVSILKKHISVGFFWGIGVSYLNIFT